MLPTLGARQLDAIGVGSIRQRDSLGAVRHRRFRQQVVEACPAEWSVNRAVAADGGALEAGWHQSQYRRAPTRSTINVMSSAAPVTANRPFMTRNTLVIDQPPVLRPS